MPEFSIDFAAKLAQVAREMSEEEVETYAGRRTVLYLSRLSAEICMKALLERAGVPIRDIAKRRHNLRQLLDDVSKCEVEVEVMPGRRQWCSASRVRAAAINLDFFDIAIGEIIDAEDQGVSRYPNEIRYGETFTDFDPWIVSQSAERLVGWAKEHWKSIRRAS